MIHCNYWVQVMLMELIFNLASSFKLQVRLMKWMELIMIESIIGVLILMKLMNNKKFMNVSTCAQ